jgi:hypothetical protein
MWIFLDIDGVLVPEKQFDNYLGTEDILKFDPTCLNEFKPSGLTQVRYM